MVRRSSPPGPLAPSPRLPTTAGSRWQIGPLDPAAGVNLAGRILTVGSRGLLLLLSARHLGLEEFGELSLILATLTVGVAVVGLELYAVTGRRIPGRPLAEAAAVIGGQCRVHLLAYLAAGPLLWGLFRLKLLPGGYFAFVYAALVLEHWSMETFRWLLALERHVEANLVVSLKGAVVVGTLVLLDPPYGLKALLTMVLISQAAASVAGAWFLRGWFRSALNRRREGAATAVAASPISANVSVNVSVNVSAVVSAIGPAMWFYVSTLAATLASYLGQYVLKAGGTSGQVGVLAFFQSLGNTMPLLVHATVIQAGLPRLCRLANTSSAGLAAERECFERRIRGACLLLYPALILASHAAALWSRKAEMLSYWVIYPVATAAALNVLWLIPNYRLYLGGRYRAQCLSSLAGCGASLALNVWWAPAYGAAGAALATLGSAAVLAASGWWQARRVERASSVCCC